MKRVVAISFIIFAFAWLFLSPTSVSAAHGCNCGIGTGCDDGTCPLPPTNDICKTGCIYSCWATAATNLRYSAENNLTVNLAWDSGTKLVGYIVNVLDSSGAPVVSNVSTPNLTYSFPAEVGETYTWTVRAYNLCNGATATGPLIGITDTDPDPDYTPATLNAKFYINYGELNQCLNQECNGEDIIVGFDDNHDRIVPIRIEVTDANAGDAVPGKFTDIKEFRVLFDNDEYWDPTLYRLIYTDDGAGNRNFTEENVGTNKYLNELEIRNINIDRYGDYKTLVIEFDLDLTLLPQDNYFLSNVYYVAEDFSGIRVDRKLVVGTGDTLEQPDDPYAPNSIDALDIWNGKDVAVKNVGFYQTSFENLDTQGGDWFGTEITDGIGLATTYSPPSTDWLSSLLSWNINTYYQPYFYYDGNQYIVYEPAPEASIILTGMNNLLYGGSVVTADANGRITNIFKNGGVRTGDSGVGDTSYETAFSVIQVSSSWSKIIDGSLFSGANFDLGIEPLTCPVCVLLDTVNSDNNGLLLANGDITAKDETHYGSVKNWYAETQDSINPFNNLEIDKDYGQILGLFAEDNPDTFTELLGSQTIINGSVGTSGLESNHTYFVKGNLTIAENLDVAENTYLLFVVDGDLTINQGVTRTEGMFIVFGDIIVQDDEDNYTDDLTIEGALVASGSIHFGRSLYVNNNTSPAVTVIFRPDMLGKMAAEGIGIIDLQTSITRQL